MKKGFILLGILLASVFLLLLRIIIFNQKNDDNFKNEKNYNIVNTAEFNTESEGFSGGVFDGRYIYFSPIRNIEDYFGQVTRYDTKQSITEPTAWSFYDTAKLNSDSRGFGGAVFDGKFVYFVPNYNLNHRSGLVTRYDKNKEFTNSSSWSFFDTAKLNDNSRGFWGGVFDGKYLYFVPHHNGKENFGQVSRYDSTKPFMDSLSWDFFDLTKINTNLRGFLGAVYDNRYIYFIPNRLSNSVFSGLIARYDTKAEFASSSSWSYLDLETLNKDAHGFAGGTFDGKYLYLSPLFKNENEFNGLITRYDTTQPFINSESWSFFDAAGLNSDLKGFIGAIYDGNYVYFTPFRSKFAISEEIVAKKAITWCSIDQTGGYSGVWLRYDTKDNFNQSSSWNFFNITKLNPEAKGYWGGLFDGKFIYLVTAKSACSIAKGIVVRYDTSR